LIEKVAEANPLKRLRWVSYFFITNGGAVKGIRSPPARGAISPDAVSGPRSRLMAGKPISRLLRSFDFIDQS
jgi:hypothetical protein